MLIRNRLPQEYFTTGGTGQSDITIHAGSYHLALREAGIEAANIMTYSSILPGTAKEIAKSDAAIVHGEVMETISAVAHCERGETATAGIIYGWLDDTSGSRYGGLVCEYNGPMKPENVEPHLRDMLNELHTNGYEHYRLTDVTTLMESVTPTKQYGTALVAICFTSYEVSWT